MTAYLDVETVPVDTPAVATLVAEAAAKYDDGRAPLYPVAQRVVCVGMSYEGRDGRLLSAAFTLGATGPAPIELAPLDETTLYRYESEAALLANLNQRLEHVRRIVTFSGRTFDVPVLVHRSVVNEVRPADVLLTATREPRYKPYAHVDLLEEFTFRGMCWAKGGLALWSVAHGFPSPKQDHNGGDVAALVAAGKWDEIAAYCLGDVLAVYRLHQRWTRWTNEGGAF